MSPMQLAASFLPLRGTHKQSAFPFPSPAQCSVMGVGRSILATSGEFISQAMMAATDKSPSLLKSHPLNSSQKAIVSHGFPCCLKGLVPLGIPNR